MFPWAWVWAVRCLRFAAGYNGLRLNRKGAETLAEDKLYKAEYVGSGTFLISKPKRKKSKQRQSNLKNVSRGSRK
jgi:hypothetical protein